MKKQDAKTYLRQIRSEWREIRILENKIKEKRFELMPSGIRYDKDKVQTSPADTLSQDVTELVEYENKLKSLLTRLYNRQSNAADAISKIPSSEQRQVLEVYYLSENNPTWDDVAEELSLSRRSVTNHHGEALLWLNDNIAFKI